VRGRARADAQGRCDGAGSGEIGLRKPSGALILCRRVFAFCLLCHISLVRSRSGGLGYSNAKTARLILPGAQTSAFCRAAVRMPLSTRRPSHRGVRTAANNLTNQQGIIVRTSGAKIVTRYNMRPEEMAVQPKRYCKHADQGGHREYESGQLFRAASDYCRHSAQPDEHGAWSGNRGKAATAPSRAIRT
jgi:hypothetical protein